MLACRAAAASRVAHDSRRPTAALERAGGPDEGTYLIVVTDRSRKDNFELQGPGGLSKKTGIHFVGRVTWRLKLGAGAYRYFSERHPSLHGSFKVV